MKAFIAIGAVLAFLSVAFGAFGAHVLKTRLTEQDLAVFQTGVHYQMYHALGLIVIGILALTIFSGQSTLLSWSGWLMTVGVLLFSGSLYALTLSGVRVLGAITPIGGVLFLISWVLVVTAALRA
ncbi:DUF423 domain-containing protein [Sporolactobacillus inulinus]|jgi:uncharacterized membrane protein YgdD (TMEM256/DUF423 family)|uniref:Membrane protein n=1 Tax=Sporolactobacillus inulinus CASD TaxID=1069536 RepID=A0A0U1QRZ7_9BACL|nr:DUF423 domain-containing protein [Sporolactobacillus inulinus]KLI03522.1 membrane protein [Sporolactobacillus inulinus CASD]GEB77811.1 membrane protein [Sporolactobacillus inulinus]